MPAPDTNPRKWNENAFFSGISTQKTPLPVSPIIAPSIRALTPPFLASTLHPLKYHRGITSNSDFLVLQNLTASPFGKSQIPFLPISLPSLSPASYRPKKLLTTSPLRGFDRPSTRRPRRNLQIWPHHAALSKKPPIRREFIQNPPSSIFMVSSNCSINP